MKKMNKRTRHASYYACMALAAAIILALIVAHMPPSADRYASVHGKEPIPPLWGLSADSLVNSGDAKALDALPGVGEVISQRIIETRELLGGFRLPEDLMLVKGIGVKTFENIMDALNDPLVQLPEIEE